MSNQTDREWIEGVLEKYSLEELKLRKSGLIGRPFAKKLAEVQETALNTILERLLMVRGEARVEEIDFLFQVAKEPLRSALGEKFRYRYINLGGKNPQTLDYIIASNISDADKDQLTEYAGQLAKDDRLNTLKANDEAKE